MSKVDIKNFYRTVVEHKKFDSNFWNKLKAISTEEELKSFMEEKVQPVAKEMGYSFSTEELLEYEKQMARKITKQQLEAISGGINAKNLTLGGIVSLMALGAAGFTSINFTQASEGEIDTTSLSQTVTSTEQDVTNPISKSSKDFTEATDEISKENPQSTSSLVDPRITDIEASKMSVGSKGKIDEINYEIGYAYITLSGDSAIDIEKIPKILLDYSKVHNKSFYIDKNIKSIKLNGDEKINIRGAFALKKITITGKNLATYEIKKDIIELSVDPNNPIDIVQIPQSAKPIKINKGVKSIILQSDEIIDISEAYDLEKIDATQSTRYDSDENNIALYEKGTKNIASIIKRSNIGELCYLVEDDNIFLGTDEYGVSVDMSKIPSVLKNLNKKFTIIAGVKSITLQGDEIIDISYATDLEEVSINGVTYKIHRDEILVDSNEQIDDTKIPQFLKDLKKPFKPGKIVK